MQQAVKTVLAKTETTQTTRGPIYKFYDQYGTEYSTFVQQIAEQALPFLGQPVTVVYDSRPSRDGRFENRYLQSVESDGGAVIAAAPIPTPPAPPQAFPGAQTIPPAGTATMAAAFPGAQMEIPVAGPEYQRAKHPDEQRAIRRAVALQAAVATVPYLEKKLSDPNQVLAIAEVWESWLAG